MKKVIKIYVWKLFCRRKKCDKCAYLQCVSNHSPCYNCYKYSEYLDNLIG